MRVRLLLLACLALASFAPPALAAAKDTFVLTYKDSNKWVAQGDNKPLVALMKLARGGVTRFSIKLPEDGRALAVERVQVLQDLLAREAKTGVLLEEVNGSALPGTVWVRAER